MTKKIVLLAGDGVGPEVAGAAHRVLMAIAAKQGLSLTVDEKLFGGAAIDATGAPYPEETAQACGSADAVFLGAVGGPKWDDGGPRPEQGLLDLRQHLGVFANLRPITMMPGMEARSPLKDDVVRNVDILIVRELNGGIYYGDRVEGAENASDLCAYSRGEVERVARIAFEAAKGRRGRLASVDKANVLATSRLWRKAVTALGKAEFGDIALDHVLVDAMAMKLITTPSSFDVILTENMFGDILSDEASVLTGSIGLAPSASLGDGPGLYEPIHGSAPDIAGQAKANPVGAILSAAMMLRYSLGAPEGADAIELAVQGTLQSGCGTPDIGGTLTTDEMTEEIISRLS